MASQTVSGANELRRAVSNAGPGDEVVARGGTYDMSSQWRVTSGGNENNRLVIRAADGERPHIRFAAGMENPTDDSGIQFRSPYVTFRGFEVSESGWKGVNIDGNGHHVVFEDLDVHHCNRWGIMNNGSDNVVYRNCDSHHNAGDTNNSDGFNMTGPASNGLIEGCRSWANGDDGFDCWVSEDHTIRYCRAWDNGRQPGGTGDGFKLGGGPNRGGGHLVHHCAAWDNMRRGFDWNTTDNALEVYNCTAFDNPLNYRFTQDGSHYTLRNNISYNGDEALGNVDDQNNSWNLGISDPEFRSLDRGADGFLRLSEGSPAIDAGVEVGLDYEGDAPDLGAYEYGGGGQPDPDPDPEPDPDPNPSSGSAQPVMTAGAVTLTASDAAVTSVKRESQHDGYTGEGYLNATADSGSVISWSLDVARGGRYDIEIRFANGDSSSRAALLRHGDNEAQITFPSTGAWTSYETMTETVELPSAQIDLEIETTGEDAGNVDAVRVSGPGYERPDEGQDDWHVPLNQNFAAIEADVRLLADIVASLDDGDDGSAFGDYARPAAGADDWDDPLNANFADIESDLSDLAERAEDLENGGTTDL